MKKIIIPLLLAMLVLAACGSGVKTAEPGETHAPGEAYDNLLLQIELSRDVWAKGGDIYSEENLARLAESGKRALAVAENVNSTDEECDAARKELKEITAEIKNSVIASSAQFRSLGEYIEQAEGKLAALSGDEKTELENAVSEAYEVYTSKSTASEVKNATNKLKKLIK